MMRKEYRQSKIGGQITGRALHGAVGATFDFHLDAFQLILRVRRERGGIEETVYRPREELSCYRKSQPRLRTAGDCGDNNTESETSRSCKRSDDGLGVSSLTLTRL